MIVKIQRSMFSSSGISTMLVYDEGRSIMMQRPLTKRVAKLLGDAPKGYFHAKMNGRSLQILGKAPDQSW